MIRKLLLSITCLAVLQLNAQVVFQDDFETGLSNWTLTGYWGTDNTQSVSGSNSLADSPNGFYQNNIASTATLASSLDLSTVLDAELELEARFNIEEGFDYCYVEVSPDNGSTWILAHTFNGPTGNPGLSAWQTYTIPMGGYVGNTDVLVRFRWESDGGLTLDGIYIDDVTITTSNTDNTAPLILHTAMEDYEGQLDTNFRTASIIDISGVASATLTYEVDGILASPITAQSISGNDYEFAIPPQVPGAYVNYWISATDSSAQANTIVTDTFKYISGRYLKHDNGIVDYIEFFGGANVYEGAAMRISLGGKTQIVSALVRTYTDPNYTNDSMQVHVWDDQGVDLITPITVYPSSTLSEPYRTTRVDLRSLNTQLSGLDGDVYVGFTAPNNQVTITKTQPSGTPSGRARRITGGTWSTNTTDDYHMRLVTGHVAPIADFTFDNSTDPEVTFADASQYSVTSWAWDFTNNGVFDDFQENTMHIYPGPGLYNACLAVVGPGGTDTTCKNIIILKGPPQAKIFYDNNDPWIDFRDTSKYDPTSWYWEFGDGETDTVQHPSHLYKDTGYYEVCLTVANTNGIDTVCEDSVHITLGVYFDYEANEENLVNFTDISSLNVIIWNWAFGDGETSNQENPSHQYPLEGGTFSVCLTGKSTATTELTRCGTIVLPDVTPIPIDSGIGINETNNSDWTVYPNPASDVLNLKAPEGTDLNQVIPWVYSIDGRRMEVPIKRSSENISISVEGMSKGHYFVELNIGTLINRIQFMVQ